MKKVSADPHLDLLMAIKSDLQRLDSIERELKALKEEIAAKPAPTADKDAPMTTEELVKHLNVGGETPKAQLRNLRRQCAFLRIEPLTRARGWNATFSRRKVLAAELNA